MRGIDDGILRVVSWCSCDTDTQIMAAEKEKKGKEN